MQTFFLLWMWIYMDYHIEWIDLGNSPHNLIIGFILSMIEPTTYYKSLPLSSEIGTPENGHPWCLFFREFRHPDAYIYANMGIQVLYLRWICASHHENRHHILMPISTKNMGTPMWKWYEFRDLDACKKYMVQTIHYKIQVVVLANYLVITVAWLSFPC